MYITIVPNNNNKSVCTAWIPAAAMQNCSHTHTHTHTHIHTYIRTDGLVELLIAISPALSTGGRRGILR